MNDTGYKTTEFWMATITNIVIAVISILVLYGVITAEEGELWKTLAIAIALPLVTVILGSVTRSYVQSRTDIKVERSRAESVR